MGKNDPKKVLAKTVKEATTVLVSGVVAGVAAPALQELGVELSTEKLVLSIMVVLTAAVRGVCNWWKHRR